MTLRDGTPSVIIFRLQVIKPIALSQLANLLFIFFSTIEFSQKSYIIPSYIYIADIVFFITIFIFILFFAVCTYG